MAKPIPNADLEAIFKPRANVIPIPRRPKPEPFEANEITPGAAVMEWLAEHLPAVALGLVVGMMMTVGLAFVWSRFL